jgi:hypothetical protein
MKLIRHRFLPLSRPFSSAGYTLAETMIAVACAVIVGGFALSVQTNALNLFRKNGAFNASHEGARKIFDRLQKEIQSAISIPALVGTNRDVIDSTGPAPGIAFLRQSGPTRRVTATSLAGSNTIQLDSSGPPITVGQRLLLPAYDIEGDITAVNGGVVTLATSLPIDVRITSGTLNRNIVAIVTDLVCYVVINGELREYQNAATNDYVVVATKLTEPNPFGLPFNAVPNTAPTP